MRGGIAKKGNNYYAYLWIGGKKKWFSGAGDSKRRAEKILNEKVSELNSGAYQEIKKIRFKEFSTLWLESYAKSKAKPSTFKSYEDIIDKHLKPKFGDYLLTEINTALLQKYVAMRLESVKPKTVVNEIVPIKKMFKHAVRWGYLKVDPAGYVERPRVEKEEMDILTPAEIRPFLDAVTPKYRPFFLTAILTGARRGELLGLQWRDVDWRNNQIHVRRSVWKRQFVTPKSKTSTRRIDMSPHLATELKKHKLACPKSEFDLIFCNEEGKHLDPDSLIKRQFLPALRRAKVRQVRFHDLRHTNTALRIAEGQNIKYIQHQLGHASIQTTLDRYGHLIKEVNGEQAKKLDNILGFGRSLVEVEAERGYKEMLNLL
jgi:integrase